MNSSVSIMVLRFVCSIFLANCSHSQYPLHPVKIDRDRESFVARAKDGMIASSHPLASKAGIKMLKEGGNVVDAAVAASFAISVLRPQSTGIGGGGFLLHYDSSAKVTKAYDFRERAPSLATTQMFIDPQTKKPRNTYYKGVHIPSASINGHLSVGVPGLVAGLVEIHQKHGKLPLEQVMAPSIQLADKGFEVYPSLENALKRRSLILKNYKSTREIFFPQGNQLKVGDVLIQKDLANTLTLISKYGRDGFYKGTVANLLLKEMEDGQGIITQSDLDNYRVIERKPVSGSYKDHKIVSMPPPSSGGVHILQILNILENDKLEQWYPFSHKRIHLLAEAMRRAYADRAKYLGDPEFNDIPMTGLLSKEYAQELRKNMSDFKASLSKSVSAGNPLPYESPSTTHISVVDPWGNAISTTQTINYTFGSGVVAAGTGVVLNDEMDDFTIDPNTPNVFGLLGGKANEVAAKKTMLSSMSPTFVFDKEEQLKLVVGSPGGSKIITATLQTIMNVIDYEMKLLDAIHTFRIHHQWFPDHISIEPKGLNLSTQKELELMGHRIENQLRSFGDVQGIAREDDAWVGVSDPRSDGQPLGYDITYP